MSVDLPPPSFPPTSSRAAELRALRRAHARASALEISELELEERVRALGGQVERSSRHVAREVVDDPGLAALVAASKRVSSVERELLVTRQARRRASEEVRVRTRRLLDGEP